MNTTAITGLYRSYHLVIYRYFKRMTGSPDLAEDLTQDLFLRVLKGIRRYEERDLAKAWLFRIARNLLLDHWRAQSKSPPPPDTPRQGRQTQPPTQLLGLSLEQSLNKLPRAEHEALVLCEVGGLSYGEIADITGASTNSIRSRIFRARRALRSDLAEELKTSHRALRMEKTS